MLFVALSAALAGELHVQVDSPVAVYVDGQQLPVDAQKTAHAKGLAEGMHSLLIKDLTDRVVADTSVKVAEAEWVLVKLDGGEIWPVQREHLAAQAPLLPDQVNLNVSISLVELATAGFASPEPGPTPSQLVIEPNMPMDDKAFAGLLAAVGDESFSDDQLGLIQGAAGSNHFTCAQVAALMETFSFSTDQVQVARTLRPRIVDPENSHLLNAPLDFSSDKDAVQALFR
jgi:hypothetical protein